MWKITRTSCILIRLNSTLRTSQDGFQTTARDVGNLAKQLGTTRSAAAVDLWDHRLDGAIVAVGNAPTALFRLLEHIAIGGPVPAAILGFPVGFVGAAESKKVLADKPCGAEFVTVFGTRGGSAIAAAAVNALSLAAKAD